MIDVTKLIWILLIGLIISGCSNTKVDPCDKSAIVYKKLDGELNKTVCFSSIDSYDLNYKDRPEIIIYGNLSFPDVKQDSYSPSAASPFR